MTNSRPVSTSTDMVSGPLPPSGGYSSQLSTPDVKSFHFQFPWISFFTGGSVGLLSSALLQPLDVLKTTLISPSRPSSSMIQTTRFLIKEHGLFVLWRGLQGSLLRIALGSSVYFSTQTAVLSLYDHYHPASLSDTSVHKSSSSHSSSHSKLVHLLVGAGSRATAVFVCCPVSVVKTRMEAQTPSPYKNVLSGLHQLGSKEGIRGLYAGLVPSVLKDAPYAGLYLMLYQSTKPIMYSLFSDKEDSKLTSALVQASSAGIAASISTFCFQPFEVVKTRMQLIDKIQPIQFINRTPSSFSSSPPSSVNSMLQITKRIWDSDGFTGFYRGVVPRILRRSLANALSWMSFEQINAFFKQNTHL